MALVSKGERQCGYGSAVSRKQDRSIKLTPSYFPVGLSIRQEGEH